MLPSTPTNSKLSVHSSFFSLNRKNKLELCFQPWEKKNRRRVADCWLVYNLWDWLCGKSNLRRNIVFIAFTLFSSLFAYTNNSQACHSFIPWKRNVYFVPLGSWKFLTLLDPGSQTKLYWRMCSSLCSQRYYKSLGVCTREKTSILGEILVEEKK